jgi:hypothetical protein
MAAVREEQRRPALLHEGHAGSRPAYERGPGAQSAGQGESVDPAGPPGLVETALRQVLARELDEVRGPDPRGTGDDAAQARQRRAGDLARIAGGREIGIGVAP